MSRYSKKKQSKKAWSESAKFKPYPSVATLDSSSSLAGSSGGMSIPSTTAKGLKAGGSSLIVTATGRLEEALGGHRELIKKL